MSPGASSITTGKVSTGYNHTQFGHAFRRAECFHRGGFRTFTEFYACMPLQAWHHADADHDHDNLQEFYKLYLS